MAIQPASGPQAADGALAVSAVTGGTAPYQYLWTPGNSTDDMLQNLPPGTYTLHVTDAHDCVATQSLTVGYVSATESAPAPVSLLIYPNPTNGPVLVTGDFSGEKPDKVVFYNTLGEEIRTEDWPAEPGHQARFFSSTGLAAGLYTACVQDGTGRVVGRGRLVKE